MKKKILVIEDDYEMYLLEKRLLEGAGYEVIGAEDAKKGLDLANEKNPDLIIMDIKLPSKKRGIGAARLLRSEEKTRNTPIVFVTGYAQGEKTKEVRNIPNCGYMTKPVNLDTFVEEIERYIK